MDQVVVGAVMQVAFVVDQIEEEMERWAKTLRVGPFFYLPHFPLVDVKYRGEACELEVDVALAFSGTTCFELVSQRSKGPSPFVDHAGRPRLGFHHWAIRSTHFDDDIARHEREGLTLVGTAKVAVGGRVAYLEKPGLPGLLELIEWTPGARELFGMVQAASRDWDGRDPIRRLGG